MSCTAYRKFHASALWEPKSRQTFQAQFEDVPQKYECFMINFIFDRLLKRAGLTPEKLQELVEQTTKVYWGTVMRQRFAPVRLPS
jgi:hypothetical protein